MAIRFKTGILCAFLILGLQGKGQSFNELLSKLNSVPEAGKSAIVKAFLLNQKAIPIVESDSVIRFLYFGNATSVSVAGDATAWAPGLNMARIEGTDLWYVQATYPPDTRLEYKIVVNGKDWKLDSLNQQVVQGGMGPNSEIVMPRYERPMYVNERDVVPWGFYTDTVIQSKFLEEPRKIRIYTPPNYEKSNAHYPVAYFHDGFQFFDLTAARNVFDNMTFEQKMKPILAVFVEPVHRDDEYSGNLQAKYTRFMLEELMPFMEMNYRTMSAAENVAQFGISNGGNIALWIAASHPEKVGKVAAFSSNVGDNVNKAFSKGKCKSQMIFLNLGKYDIPFLIPLVHELKKTLTDKSCPLSYQEYPEGHNWAFWQKHLPDALEYFFPVN